MRCAETALYDLIESNEGCATVFAWLCWRKPNLADQRQGLKQKNNKSHADIRGNVRVTQYLRDDETSLQVTDDTAISDHQSEVLMKAIGKRATKIISQCGLRR
ncbi:hypothetical protein [Thalassospira tepidiphila]|jgi:hypothetical protein|uniref:hypothetical protein n=1 Tax=Thalassospira tepidiphila TaxID=393657 RepID=UPI001BCF68DA|nr:hypothetical protein [Thalassospira tepidiphila]